MNENDEMKENFLSSLRTDIKNMKSFRILSTELKKDPDFIIEILKTLHQNQAYVGQYEDLVSDVIKELTINKEVALKLVNYHGYLICKLPEKFKEDEEVVIAAIHSYPFSIIYTSKEIKDNKKIALEAVKARGDNLESISKRLCEDEEVVLAAVKKDGRSINFAPKLWSNKKVMLEAVKTNHYALQYLGQNLIGDKEIALEAYKCDKFAYDYFPKELKQEIIDNNVEDIISYLKSITLVKELENEMSSHGDIKKKIKI